MNWNVVQLYIILLQLSRLRWNTHCLRACLSLFVSLEMSTQKLYKSVKPAIITMASTDIGVAQGKGFHLESLISCLLCPKQFWSYYEKKAKCIVWNFIYLFYRFSTFRDFRPAVNKHYSAFPPLVLMSLCQHVTAFQPVLTLKAQMLLLCYPTVVGEGSITKIIVTLCNEFVISLSLKWLF